ncbi:ABC transporter substrate-binding protein, partial [Candidatus Woesearchaeota archaeon]|nr:ABC transporter substrate-binding protein [Candidatus Woesearchaeota archaeon]
MKPTNLAIAIAMLALVLVCGCTQTPTGQAVQEQEELKIGVIAPLTGAVARFGEYMRQSFDMAVDDINAQGGVNGKKIKLLYEDTQCIDLKATTSALKKFKEIDEVPAVLGPYCGGPSAVAGQFSTDNNLFIISSGDNLGKAGTYMVTTRFLLKKEATLLAEYIFNQGLEKAGIIYYENDWGRTYRDSLEAYFEEHNGKLVSEETYDYGNLDIKTQLLKIKKAGAQAVVIIDGTGGTLFRHAKEINYDLPLFSEWEIQNPAH